MSDNYRRVRFLFLGCALLVVVLDQITKFWVKANIPLGGSLPASGFFRLTHIQNTGAAWGIFQDSTLILAIISGIASVLILVLGLFMQRRIELLGKTRVMLALGLILGGTIGNFIDRAFIGYVTDFLKMGTFPDYNIADSSIVVGGILLAYTVIRYTASEAPVGTSDTSCGRGPNRAA